MLLRIKTYTDTGKQHGKFDFTLEDISYVAQLIDDIGELIPEEYDKIEEEKEDGDGIDNF